MKRFAQASAALVLALTLSACGGDEEDEPIGTGLLPGQEEVNEAPPPVELPEQPVDTFEGDLSTPEGTIGTYMNYMQLGDGTKVCELFTDKLLKSYGGSVESCVVEVEDYAKAVLPEFEDSLPVADRLTVKIESNSGTTAKGSAAVLVNTVEETTYFEGFNLVTNPDGTWAIDGLSSVAADETSN